MSNQKENPVVTVAEGRLRGMCQSDLNGDSFYGFLGIPYAKPPMGSLRFKVSVCRFYFSKKFILKMFHK